MVGKFRLLTGRFYILSKIFKWIMFLSSSIMCHYIWFKISMFYKSLSSTWNITRVIQTNHFLLKWLYPLRVAYVPGEKTISISTSSQCQQRTYLLSLPIYWHIDYICMCVHIHWCICMYTCMYNVAKEQTIQIGKWSDIYFISEF